LRKVCSIVVLVCLAAGLAAASETVAAPHYVATYLPPGHRFSKAEQYGGKESFVGYRSLAVRTHVGSCCGFAYTRGRSITVRGRRATLARYLDEGSAYGRMILWEERPKVWVEIEANGRRLPSDRQLIRVAEGVRRARRGEWKLLLIESSPPPSRSQLPHGRPSKVVLRGRARGHRWVLRVLVPRGFPLDENDRRVPCYELSYQRARTYGFDCAEPTSWWLLKGQIFVFGQIHSRVRSVTVGGLTPRPSVRERARVGRVAPVEKWSFYVAAMPRNTCHVEVTYRTRRGKRRDLGPTGPIFDPRELRRCNERGGEAR
jgi:hypothetical protein